MSTSMDEPRPPRKVNRLPKQAVTSDAANQAIAETLEMLSRVPDSEFTGMVMPEVPDLDGMLGVIFGPIRPLLPDAQAFLSKKLGDATGAELAAFAICVGYALAVGYFGAGIAVGVIRASARRPIAVRVPLQLR
jgi:hypothetical protein